MSSPASPAAAEVTRTPVLATSQQGAVLSPHAALARSRATAHRRPVAYRVRAGDTLSSIAQRVYHDRSYWTAIYWRNHRQLRWANQIKTGQVLHIPAKPERAPAAPGQLGPLPAPAPRGGAASTPAGVADISYSGPYPGGAFGACVVARESGGNAQIMNATGHYGLYQFSAATWAAYSGNPADFGHASAAEQNQVFANALAAGGESNWAPYDGC
jgi:LysM repeat protein